MEQHRAVLAVAVPAAGFFIRVTTGLLVGSCLVCNVPAATASAHPTSRSSPASESKYRALRQAEIDGTALAKAYNVISNSYYTGLAREHLPPGTRVYATGKLLIKDGSTYTRVPILMRYTRNAEHFTARAGGRVWTFSPNAIIAGVAEFSLATVLPGIPVPASLRSKIASGDARFVATVKR